MTEIDAPLVQKNSGRSREYTFTSADFARVRDLLMEKAGISLSDIKTDMVYGRLSKRLRVLKLSRFSDYLDMVEDSTTGKDEQVHFINSMTTNLTAFFRERHHFEYLQQELLPRLRDQGQRRLRVWSAGCSVGEEPYSLAMSIRETLGPDSSWDVRILATDIDTQVLEQARSGCYSLDRIGNSVSGSMQRWLLRGSGSKQGLVRIKPELRQMVTYRPLNLMGEWPMSGPFDIIFCRNVMIYFDNPTQEKLLDRMAQLLTYDGLLFIGHSENISQLTDRFTLLGKTIYQKVR